MKAHIWFWFAGFGYVFETTSQINQPFNSIPISMLSLFLLHTRLPYNSCKSKFRPNKHKKKNHHGFFINIGAQISKYIAAIVSFGHLRTRLHSADPGVVSSITVQSHNFVEIDHEIMSTGILFPSTESFQKSCCQLQAKICA